MYSLPKRHIRLYHICSCLIYLGIEMSHDSLFVPYFSGPLHFRVPPPPRGGLRQSLSLHQGGPAHSPGGTSAHKPQEQRGMYCALLDSTLTSKTVCYKHFISLGGHAGEAQFSTRRRGKHLLAKQARLPIVPTLPMLKQCMQRKSPDGKSIRTLIAAVETSFPC